MLLSQYTEYLKEPYRRLFKQIKVTAMNQIEDLEYLSKENYLRSLHERVQNSIVNFKSSDTCSAADFIWTYKSTYCDVLSVITTSDLFGAGTMKDIKLRNKEMKRCQVIV